MDIDKAIQSCPNCQNRYYTHKKIEIKEKGTEITNIFEAKICIECNWFFSFRTLEKISMENVKLERRIL
jgi:predicted nucleic-acid-binding Zn-ribbon protein